MRIVVVHSYPLALWAESSLKIATAAHPNTGNSVGVSVKERITRREALTFQTIRSLNPDGEVRDRRITPARATPAKTQNDLLSDSRLLCGNEDGGSDQISKSDLILDVSCSCCGVTGAGHLALAGLVLGGKLTSELKQQSASGVVHLRGKLFHLQ
jgi:hypothetical protein